ncbi:MAG: hypothetical protein HPY50_03780 [Firmicutes bacterium]|nr:hypothetical protein [Bacillota bacterium]
MIDISIEFSYPGIPKVLSGVIIEGPFNHGSCSYCYKQDCLAWKVYILEFDFSVDVNECLIK